jgi:hypothetical protein
MNNNIINKNKNLLYQILLVKIIIILLIKIIITRLLKIIIIQ